MGVFFALYFVVMNFPVFPVTQMPAIGLDRATGFHPWTLLLYGSLWLYVSLPPVFLATLRQGVRYAGMAAAVGGVGMLIFFFWPTKIPPPEIDWSRYPGFDFLRHIDSSGNACPSLHVAFAVFSGVWLDRILRRASAPGWARVLNLGWGLGIAYSTLATKQHVALDVGAGAVLGLLGAALRRAIL